MNEHAFRFKLPNDWEDQTVYYFRGPEENGREHMLMLVLDRNLQHDDINSFAKEQTEPVTASLHGIEILKDEEITVERGNQAYEFVYKWMPAEGVSVFKKYVFVIRNGIGFSFSCEFSKKTLKTIGVGMKDVIEALLPGTYQPPEED